MNGYFNIGGREYYGYDVICKTVSWYAGKYITNNNVAMNDEFKEKFENGDILDNKTPIPDGASLHIIQPCPIPNDDIRKYYKIKRTIDTGDFNVFPDIKTHVWMVFKHVIISEKARSIILSENAFTGQKHDDAVTFTNFTVYFLSLNEQWMGLLDGILDKPCVSYKRLSINTGNKLTPEALFLLYRLGMMPFSRDGVEKFKLQLQAINQTDWREYQNSVRKVIEFASAMFNCSYHVRNHKSERNKVTEQFFNIDVTEYTDKDFKMLGDTMSLILDIDETKYVSVDEVNHKLLEKGISVKDIETFFGGIVQLKRREWKDA